VIGQGAVQHVERLDLTIVPRPWPFAQQRRAEIDAHFAQLQRRKPEIWNGRVLLLHDHSLEHDVLRGAFLETDFASFVAWRDWGRPDAGVQDCFGAAAVEAADGGILLGVMADHTANAGQVYFPCGTPDPSDIAGATVDLESSTRRELAEETGLNAGDLIAAPGWTLVRHPGQLALIKTMRSALTGAALHAAVAAHLAHESEPELADVRLVGSPADIDPAVPEFVQAFLRHHWR
jgi:8-oxo-dGTP pyrophosphatase MutT (NUDIX family)